MIGIKRDEVQICVQHLSCRKKPCLVVMKGNAGRVVASFQNEETAKLLFKALDYILDGGDFCD